MSSDKFEITYVVIPGEVAFNPKLSHLDKFVFWVVNSLSNGSSNRGCDASNNYIADKLGVNPKSIARSITRLVKKGYLNRVIKSNNKRRLTVKASYVKKHYKHIRKYNSSELSRGNTNVTGGVTQMLPYKYIYKYKSHSKECDAIKNRKTKKLVCSSKKKRKIFYGYKKKFKKDPFDVDKLVEHWNSLGKPFTRHIIVDYSKTLKKSRKLLIGLLEKDSPGKIKKAMNNWHQLMSEKGLVFNRNFTFLKNQRLPDFIQPDSRTLSEIHSHKPPLNITSPYRDAVKGWQHLIKKFSKVDKHPKLTRAVRQIWEEAHKPAISNNEYAEVAKKWASRYDSWVEAYEDLDALRYVISRVPTTYSVTFIVSRRFWSEYVPEKLVEYGGGF